ncbi:MAG: class I SAM-dependent methyltransferase [Chthoniobacterales bacterium]|nr:class I SAM-dependent methyltransferase [Chthoniobacterales bacterium]
MQLIEENYARLLLSSKTNCFRISSNENGFTDYWNGHILISSKSESNARASFDYLLTSSNLNWLRAISSFHSIWFRPLLRNPALAPKPTLWLGTPILEFPISESSLLYLLKIANGFSPGFFADQRENRKFLAHWIKTRTQSHTPTSLLNCFSYTCSFSVVAATYGASTTNIDISQKALQWGKQNFLLNHLPLQNHRFLQEDVLSFLQKSSRRNLKFHAIILDPPTFSRNKNKTFQIEKHLPHLLKSALQILTPDGIILLSTNCSKLSTSSLRQLAHNLAPGFHTLSLPPPPDFRSSHHSSTLWLSPQKIIPHDPL